MSQVFSSLERCKNVNVRCVFRIASAAVCPCSQAVIEEKTLTREDKRFSTSAKTSAGRWHAIPARVLAGVRRGGMFREASARGARSTWARGTSTQGARMPCKARDLVD